MLRGQQKPPAMQGEPCAHTLPQQQVITQQTDEVDAAGLGVVGPRDHGHLLGSREPMGPGRGHMASPLLAIQGDENRGREFAAGADGRRVMPTPQV